MENTPTETHLQIPLFIEHAQQGTQFTIPFTMPDNVETFSLSYHYKRNQERETPVENGIFIDRKEINVIDLGLIAPDGAQVGASGSERLDIFINETQATPGYRPCKLVPGEWLIIVGAYIVAEAGVDLVYELTFSYKYRRWFKGDLHVHTYASGGSFSLEELAQHARGNGLDFLAITDHNQMVSADTLREHAHLTLIPGMEWTHFRGHANFLGYQPYEKPYIANTLEEVRAQFIAAHEHGALIVINHPRDQLNPFEFDLEQIPFDCLEIWKGLIIENNPLAIAWWHSLLVAGKKVPICGGSDYHVDSLNRFPGGPTTCVFAMSNTPADILYALKHGHAFITYAPYGPMLEMTAGDAILGDSVQFSKVKQVEIVARGLTTGDVVQVITAQGSSPLIKAETAGDLHSVFRMDAPGFARIEILRLLHPSLPLLPVLISNPIYFDP